MVVDLRDNIRATTDDVGHDIGAIGHGAEQKGEVVPTLSISSEMLGISLQEYWRLVSSGAPRRLGTWKPPFWHAEILAPRFGHTSTMNLDEANN